MTDSHEQLKNQVLSIIKDIEKGLTDEGDTLSASDYLADVLDINYIINSDRSYKGARLLVAFGGPNIWIDTLHKNVEGYWWSDTFTDRYYTDAMGLDDLMEELYAMG